MYEQEREDQKLKMIQKYVLHYNDKIDKVIMHLIIDNSLKIPTATIESVRVYDNCMTKDAVFKSAIPYGIVSMIAAHLLIPKQLGTKKNVLTFVTGVASYLCGKIAYTPVCSQRAFGTSDLTLLQTKKRLDPSDTEKYVYHVDQEDDELKDSSYDNFVPDDLPWNSMDTTFDSHRSDFEDRGSYLEVDTTSEKPSVDVKEKKRVTYDELQMRHRQQQGDNPDAIYRGYLYRNTQRQAPSQQRRPGEEPKRRDTEMEERNVWES